MHDEHDDPPRPSTLYRKLGRRYVPIQDSAALDGLPNGCWLVCVEGGRTSCRRIVDEAAGLELLAAVPRLTEWLVVELREWSKTQPSRPLTDKERRAWAAYTDVMGDDASLMLTRPSAWDVAHKAAEKLVKRVAETKGADRA